MRVATILLLASLSATAGAQIAEIDMGAPAAPAPENVVAWNATVRPVAGSAGTYRITVTGRIAEGWRVYAMAPSVTGRPLAVGLADLPPGFEVIVPPRETAPTRAGRDEVLGVDYDYFAGLVTVEADVRAGAGARPGRHVVRGSVRYAACDERICLSPRTVRFEAPVTVAARR